jgi:hypothetical protein
MCEKKELSEEQVVDLTVLAIKKMVDTGLIQKNVWYDINNLADIVLEKFGFSAICKERKYLAGALTKLIEDGDVKSDGDIHYLGSSKPLIDRVLFPSE